MGLKTMQCLVGRFAARFRLRRVLADAALVAGFAFTASLLVR